MELFPFELTAFLISLTAFIVGAVKLFKPHVPLYFKLHIYAVGCYSLEEAWVIFNTFFGTESGFVSVRLFGTFGFFCFLLAANRGPIDRMIDERTPASRKARRIALLAPIIILLIYLLSYVPSFGKSSIPVRMLGFIILSPTFPTAWYCLKHRFLPKDSMGFLNAIAGIDIVTLVIFLVNEIYLFRSQKMTFILYFSDVVMAILVALLSVFSIWGRKKWKVVR